MAKKCVQKGDPVYSSRGFTVYEARSAGLAYLEWANQELCDVGAAMQRALCRHAVMTNFDRRQGETVFLIHRLEMLPVQVQVWTAPNEASVQLLDRHGLQISVEQALALPKVRRGRLADMLDTGRQVGRSLRAHLGAAGSEHLKLRLWFGLDEVGACVLHVPDPLWFRAEVQDAERLIHLLGGD
jgi:hypothetical protein